MTLNGGLHVADAVAETAKSDLVTAYNEAAGAGPATTVGTELGGETLTEGVYDSASGTFEMTGTLTLNAEGDPNAVFIFQMASTLVTASNSNVNLINGANACNVFWQVGSSATLGTGTSFLGNILAQTTITLNTGASVEGRVLAQTGAVTLDTNTITQVACQQSPPTTTTTVDDSTTTTVDDSTTTTVDDSATTTIDDSTTTTLDDATVTTAGRATTTTADITTNSTFLPPQGGADTGGGSTAGGPNMMLLLGGGALLLVVSTAAFVARGPTRHGSSV